MFYLKTAAVGVAIIAVTWKIVKKYRNKQLRHQWDNLGQDVVLLHQFVRGKTCPNLSPFALKVETFLRLADIQYQVESLKPFGPRGKCPWITLNGQDTSDSELVLEELEHHFSVNLDQHLEPRKAANLEAVRVLADEHLFWCVVTWRYWLDNCRTFLTTQDLGPYFNFMFPKFMVGGMKRRAEQHGIGRFSTEEIYHICRKDCATLAGVLGEDKFFGGEKPCRTDCAVFGQLAQLMWNAPGTNYQALLTDVHPTLAGYCIRMKEKVYPDWCQLLLPQN